MVILKIIYLMDMVIYRKKIKYMKDGSKMGYIVEQENWYYQIKMFMLVNSRKDIFKEKDNMYGLMVIFIKVFIKEENDKEWEYFKVWK